MGLSLRTVWHLLSKPIVTCSLVIGLTDVRPAWAQDTGSTQAATSVLPAPLAPAIEENWDFDSIDPFPDSSGASETSPPGASNSLLRVAYESLFGDITSEAKQSAWRPLALRTFFIDGWREPFVEPATENGITPRGGWVGSFEGAFFRSWFLSFAFANGLKHRGNQYLGGYTIYTPLSRRLELRIDVPFVVSNKGGFNNAYHDRFGDFIVSPRLLLSESLNFSQIFAVNFRTPTGSRLNGNGVESISPHYQFWFSPRPNWAVRGGTGAAMLFNDGGDSAFYFANLGVGRYWSGDEDAFFRHHWLSVVVNLNTPQSGSSPNPGYLSLTPGYRVDINKRWTFLAGIECPVSRGEPFGVRPIFLLLRQF